MIFKGSCWVEHFYTLLLMILWKSETEWKKTKTKFLSFFPSVCVNQRCSRLNSTVTAWVNTHHLHTDWIIHLMSEFEGRQRRSLVHGSASYSSLVHKQNHPTDCEQTVMWTIGWLCWQWKKNIVGTCFIHGDVKWRCCSSLKTSLKLSNLNHAEQIWGNESLNPPSINYGWV